MGLKLASENKCSRYIAENGYRKRNILRIDVMYDSVLSVPVAARSKAKVDGRSPAAIVGLNTTGSMDVFVLCVVR
jgi:hypothetical protein